MKHKRILKWVNRIRKEYLGKGPIDKRELTSTDIKALARFFCVMHAAMAIGDVRENTFLKNTRGVAAGFGLVSKKGEYLLTPSGLRSVLKGRN